MRQGCGTGICGEALNGLPEFSILKRNSGPVDSLVREFGIRIFIIFGA